MIKKLFRRKKQKQNIKIVEVEIDNVASLDDHEIMMRGIVPEPASLEFMNLNLSDTQVNYILSHHLDSFVRAHRNLKNHDVKEIRIQFVFRSDAEINELKKALLVALERV